MIQLVRIMDLRHRLHSSKHGPVNKSHRGQATRSPRKRLLKTQRQAAEQAKAQQLGISVGELQQRKFQEVRHLLRSSDRTISSVATLLPEAHISGPRDEATCPNCDRSNTNCIKGINTCWRCEKQFIGKR